MTETLKRAFQQAETLPEADQNRIAVVVTHQVEAAKHNADTAFTRLSEDAFAADWDNPQDADYDNWRQIYGVPKR